VALIAEGLQGGCPDMATPAACSKVTVAGLRTRLVPDATAYSAKVPAPDPRTSSPTRRSCTFVPAAATVPATSEPRTPFRGLGSPVAMRAMYGIPVTPAQSGGFTAAARTRTSTSSSVITGYPDVPEFQDVVGEPYMSWSIAFMPCAHLDQSFSGGASRLTAGEALNKVGRL